MGLSSPVARRRMGRMRFCEISKDPGCQFSLTYHHLTLNGLRALRASLAASEDMAARDLLVGLDGALRQAGLPLQYESNGPGPGGPGSMGA